MSGKEPVKRKHKKAEYLELVYDLIFVYLIKRCDALLEMEPSGFFSAESFEVYLFSILVMLQIWAFSTLFINRYGRNGWREFLLLTVNMFLLCFLAADTIEDWRLTYDAYQISWGLIVVNIAAHYLSKLRAAKAHPQEQHFLMRRLRIFAVQALLIFFAVPLYEATGFSFAWIALAIGFIGPLLVWQKDQEVLTDIEHLAERIMLFVVLSFGETLISAAEYFSGPLTLNRIYFSACAFLVVIGMLLAYGFIYSKLLDRHRMGVGTLYMFLHIFIVVAINDVTVGLEFMHNGESNDLLTLLFLVVSFLLYYATLLYMAHKAGRYYLPARQTWVPFIIISAVFTVIIFFFTSNRWVNAGISAAYPFAMYLAIFLRRKRELLEHPYTPARNL